MIRSPAPRGPMAAALVLLVGTVVVAGCTLGGPGRASTAIIDAAFVETAETDGGDRDQLHLAVAACNANPEVTFQEFDDRIEVSVIADLPGRDADGCADEETIVLSEPLGERALIDSSTGGQIPIIDPETGLPIDS